MKEYFGTFAGLMLTVCLAVGMLLSSNSRMLSHDLGGLAQIVADHKYETTDHGHSHEDIVDVTHAYQSHGHDGADHDHNTALLPARTSLGTFIPVRSEWILANGILPDRKDSSLHRPPRG